MPILGVQGNVPILKVGGSSGGIIDTDSFYGGRSNSNPTYYLGRIFGSTRDTITLSQTTAYCLSPSHLKKMTMRIQSNTLSGGAQIQFELFEYDDVSGTNPVKIGSTLFTISDTDGTGVFATSEFNDTDYPFTEGKYYNIRATRVSGGTGTIQMSYGTWVIYD